MERLKQLLGTTLLVVVGGPAVIAIGLVRFRDIPAFIRVARSR